MKKQSKGENPDYKGMLQKIEKILKDWKRTFSALEKKQNALLRKLQNNHEAEQLSKVRRTL